MCSKLNGRMRKWLLREEETGWWQVWYTRNIDNFCEKGWLAMARSLIQLPTHLATISPVVFHRFPDTNCAGSCPEPNQRYIYSSCSRSKFEKNMFGRSRAKLNRKRSLPHRREVDPPHHSTLWYRLDIDSSISFHAYRPLNSIQFYMCLLFELTNFPMYFGSLIPMQCFVYFEP